MRGVAGARAHIGSTAPPRRQRACAAGEAGLGRPYNGWGRVGHTGGGHCAPGRERELPPPLSLTMLSGRLRARLASLALSEAMTMARRASCLSASAVVRADDAIVCRWGGEKKRK